VKFLTALLIGPCGKLSQITCSACLRSAMDCGFDEKLPINNKLVGRFVYEVYVTFA